MLPILVGYVKSNQIELILEGIIGIENLLSESDSHID
jgi:hypothetical protein